MKQWKYKVGHGGVASIRWGDAEVVRRIFVTVRNRQWQEIPPVDWNSETYAEQDGVTRTRMSARHIHTDIDFEWTGEFESNAVARTLRFSFEGRANRDMEVCRLGLVALHPIDEHVGRPVTVRGPGGEECFSLTEQIHPQRIAEGLPQAICEPYSELSMQSSIGQEIRFVFDGDLFELEDQRSWGDASFKSYCTPLRMGFPRSIPAGTIVRHKVQVRLAPLAQQVPRLPETASAPAAARFPEIGRLVRGSGLRQDGKKIADGWHYVTLDLREPCDIAAAEVFAGALPLDVGLALLVTAAAAPVDQAVLRILKQHERRAPRLLLRGDGASPPDPAAVSRLRQDLAEAGLPKLPVVAATDGYFVEFNRGEANDADVDGVAFPLTATVHSDDPWTISDNVRAIRSIAVAARTLVDTHHVELCPLALYHPPRVGRTAFPEALIAPWLITSAVQAALAGVAAITLSGDVIAAMNRTAESGGADILAALIGMSGKRLVPLSPTNHAGCFALAAEKAPGLADLLIANLSGEGVTIEPEQFGMEIDSVDRGAEGTAHSRSLTVGPYEVLSAVGHAPPIR